MITLFDLRKVKSRRSAAGYLGINGNTVANWIRPSEEIGLQNFQEVGEPAPDPGQQSMFPGALEARKKHLVEPEKSGDTTKFVGGSPRCRRNAECRLAIEVGWQARLSVFCMKARTALAHTGYYSDWPTGVFCNRNRKRICTPGLSKKTQSKDKATLRGWHRWLALNSIASSTHPLADWRLRSPEGGWPEQTMTRVVARLLTYMPNKALDPPRTALKNLYR